MPKLRILLICAATAGLCSWASFTMAAPIVPPVPSRAVVIHDAGGVALGDLLENVVPDTQQLQPPTPRVQISGTALQIFPVRASSIGPALLSPQQKSNARTPTAPSVPLCIIGDDELSRQWLRANLAMLRKSHVACLVGSVANEVAFKQLQFEAPDIRMVPAAIDGLAAAARIPAWPVLISPDGRILQ